jgi:hypothetical protein
MRFASSALVLSLAIAGSSTGLQAQNFEGVITQKMTGSGMTAEITQYVKGAKFRQDMAAAGMPGGALIYDGDTGDTFMLMTAQKSYMKFPSQGMEGSEEVKTPEFTRTGEKETVAGHSCEYYKVKFENVESDICVATDLGFFYGAGGPGGMGGRRGQQGEGMSNAAMKQFAKQFKDGFFPLKIRTQAANGAATIEVIKIEKKDVSDDLFKIPSDFTEMRMGRGGA